MQRLLPYACIIGAGLLARSAIEKSWATKTGREPPNSPAQDGVGWGEALLWGAVVGTAVGIARTTIRGTLEKRPVPSITQAD